MDFNVIWREIDMKEKSLISNTIIYTFKTIFTMIFPIITFPYVSRVLGVNGMGAYNFSNSYVSYFFLLASLGISTYAVREGSKYRNQKEKFQHFAQEIYSFNIISTVCSEVILIFTLLFWSKLEEYRWIIIILSFTIFLSTIGTDWVFTVYEDFFYITIRSIIFQIVSMVLMFVFIRDEQDALKYAFVTVLANAGSNLFNYRRAKKYFRHKFVLKINFSQHFKPIMLLFASTVASQIYINSDVVMLGIIKNDYEVGLYSAASKIYNLVRTILITSVTILLPRMSFLKNNGKQEDYKKLLSKTGIMFVSVVIPASVGLIIISHNVLIVLCGKEYVKATIALSILSIALIFSVIGSFVANSILIVNAKEKNILFATIVGAIVNILANLYMIEKWGYVGAAITTLLSEIIVFMIQLIYAKTEIEVCKKDKRDLIKSSFAIVLMILISKCIISFGLDTLCETIVLILANVIAYAFVLLLTKHSLCEEFRNKIKR